MNFAKLLFFSKWKFSLPKKNKFVLIDGEYNPFLKYIKKKHFTYIYRRGEEINIPILLRCLIKFKFNSLDYFSEYIKIVSPKLILTAFDYHTIFYRISEKTGIKTLMLQKGKRSNIDGLINNQEKFFPENSKKIFFVNYMLVYNKSVKDFYSKRIRGKIYEIGSFENNSTKIGRFSKKKEILFISNYNISKDGKLSSKTENEDLVALNLFKLAKKNKIKFNILARNRGNLKNLLKEYSYYSKAIKDDFIFLKSKKKSGYDILNEYKYVFSTYSTMAIEALARGSRCGFIFCKSKSNPSYGLWFANFEKFPLNGPFWLTSEIIDSKKIEKVFNFVTKISEKKWKKLTHKYTNKLMKFDYQNKIFLHILKKILKKNKKKYT